MEIQPAKCKAPEEIFGPTLGRQDMRLAEMVVGAAIASGPTNKLGSVFGSLVLEEVLPRDVLETMPKITEAVRRALEKLSSEKQADDIELNVQAQRRAIELSVQAQRLETVQARDQAVHDFSRAIYVDGDKLPVNLPDIG